MKIFLARPRLLLAVAVAVAVPVLLVAGCSAGVTGEPAPRPGGPPTHVAPITPTPRQQTPPQPPPSGGCQVTATSTGSISSSGAGGRTATVNGRTSFSCGSGPMIGIEAIDGSGVTFSADGAPVTVAPGSDGTVGAYRVSVSRVDGDSAEFQVEPAG